MKKKLIISSIILAVILSVFCFYIIHMNKRNIVFSPSNITLSLQDINYSFMFFKVDYSDEKLNEFIEQNFSDFDAKDDLKKEINETLNSNLFITEINLENITTASEITRIENNNLIKSKHLTILQKDVTGIDDLTVPVTDLMDYENGKYVTSNNKVSDLANHITNVYETNDRDFINHNGDLVKIPNCKDSEFGWIVDTKELKNSIITAIETIDSPNNNMSIDIPFKQTGNKYLITNGVINDIGDKYIEISLDDQHLWVIDNGTVLFDCDVVTGKTEGSKSTATPRGAFYVTELKQNETMRGSYGTAFAEYWLRLTNSGIGIHAAAWRGSFGGNIYKYNGSHGCINVSVANSRWLYENIERKTPVVIY